MVLLRDFRFRPVLGVLFSLGAFGTIAMQGCGDDTEPTDQGLAFEQFAETYRQAQCERAVLCGFMPDVETCFGALAQDQLIAEAIAAVAFGDLTYDPAAAETCIQTLTTASCEGFSLFTRSILEVCDQVFGNRRNNGDPCVTAAQCAGIGAICEGSCGDGGCPGTCRGVSAAGQEGDPCSELEPCGNGFRCVYSDENMQDECIPLSGPNEPCVPFGCIEGYACDTSSNPPRCFQQAASGSSCNPALEYACADLNEYCSGEQQRCVPLPRPGEACGVNQLADYYCARMAYCADGSCEQLPAAGEPCIGNGVCLGQLQCTSGDPDDLCSYLPSPSICTNFE